VPLVFVECSYRPAKPFLGILEDSHLHMLNLCLSLECFSFYIAGNILPEDLLRWYMKWKNQLHCRSEIQFFMRAVSGLNAKACCR
jgi:hypothetical protein